MRPCHSSVRSIEGGVELLLKLLPLLGFDCQLSLLSLLFVAIAKLLETIQNHAAPPGGALAVERDDGFVHSRGTLAMLRLADQEPYEAQRILEFPARVFGPDQSAFAPLRLPVVQ